MTDAESTAPTPKSAIVAAHTVAAGLVNRFGDDLHSVSANQSPSITLYLRDNRFTAFADVAGVLGPADYWHTWESKQGTWVVSTCGPYSGVALWLQMNVTDPATIERLATVGPRGCPLPALLGDVVASAPAVEAVSAS